MAAIELNIDSANELEVRPNGRFVRVTFEANSDDVLACLDERTVIDYFGEDKILDIIGADEAKKRFGLIEAE
jgi:hypothetical protein